MVDETDRLLRQSYQDWIQQVMPALEGWVETRQAPAVPGVLTPRAPSTGRWNGGRTVGRRRV